jgi:ABC-type antimicrobial peptide transport system permease subunit
MYVPMAQVRDGVMALNNRIIPVSWAIRTNVEPRAELNASIRHELESAAGLPVAKVRSMQQVMRESTARDEFNTLLLGIFAFSAVLLASIGLYGLMSYSVQQRTLEFGIRLALGADSPGLRNMVVLQAMKLAVIGIVLGVGAAYGLTRFMATLLFNVKPNDPYVFGSVALTLAAVALAAAWVPARRAIRIDPIVALRYE